MAFGDFTVVRSTVKNVTNASNILEEVPINTPAFEFNADGSYKGLLVEPGATNLLTYSQAFDDASWTKTRLNTTGTPAWVNVGAVTPNNTVTSEKIIPTTENGTHFVTKGVPSGAYTFSVYARAGEETVMSLWLRSDSVRAEFNLADGTITTSTVTSSAIQAIGSGWYRCSVYDSTPGTTVSIYARSGGAFIGNNTDGFYIWQAQLETGVVATSPIYTVASTVARTADEVSLTSASSLIGQTEGVLYVEVSASRLSTGVTRVIASVSSATPQASTSELYFIVDSSNNLSAQFNNSGTLQCNISFGPYVAGTQKLALAYKGNDFAFYRNGAQVGVDASGSVGTGLDRVILGSYLNGTLFYYNDHIRALALFPTRLSNAQLASLTTL